MACKTYSAIATKSGAPNRRRVYNAEVVLNAIWAGCGFGHQVGGGRFCAFYLNKTFSTYCLVTASGMVDVGRIVLGTRIRYQSHESENEELN